MKTFASCITGLLVVAGLAACSDQSDAPHQEQTVAMPNPAAVYCSNQGGEYRLGSGQCKLPDGKTVDAWDYFRSQHPDQGGSE